MKKERLIAFTDAVLAIIMTILVLELEKPSEPSLAAFWALRTNFFAYALSFFWLGALWTALNSIWEKVGDINTKVVWLNILLLFLSSFIPYATSLVSDHFDSRAMQGFYGIIVILMTCANWLLHKAIDEPNRQNAELLTMTKAYRRLLIPDIAIKIIGLAIALTVYPPVMMYSVLIAAFFIIIAKNQHSI